MKEAEISNLTQAILDRAVDKLYQSKTFATDADRVAFLFEKYQERIK